MPSQERGMSRDRDMVLKHQQSFPDAGKSMVPMWDSSDPERAPPPLPLNPRSGILTSKVTTSATVAAAAKALEEKVRESSPASAYTTNPMPARSPERSLIKGAHHNRMQSLQTGSTKDLRNYFDGARTPDLSPERPSRRSGSPFSGRDNERDFFSSPTERAPSRTATPASPSHDIFKEPPSLRPTSRATTRPPARPILGENTPPPSATMLALQTMSSRDFDPPLSNVSNSSNNKGPQPFDGISSQILSLTAVATNLQREMENLSRRSRDNAQDLQTLREATSSRDEDIRTTLKELLENVKDQQLQAGLLNVPGTLSRSNSAVGASGSENKDSGASHTKAFTLPRIPSPPTFILDDRISSPNPYSVEGAASVAMLEKIIREMVTKDGQERLLGSLSHLMDKASKDSGETAKKVTELFEFIKDGSPSQALVKSRGVVPNQSFSAPGNGYMSALSRDLQPSYAGVTDNVKQRSQQNGGAEFITDEMFSLLKKIKDSVTGSGGMTSEVKALVRDLRSEVLGMGRELGRRFDSVDGGQRALEGPDEGCKNNDLTKLIHEGLAELKDHMDRVIREKRRQSASTVLSRSTVDSQEVYQMVKRTVAEQGLDRTSQNWDKEAILAAVKEAYEAYKPEIEIQQIGLEREEILQCLKEGLEEYRSIGGGNQPASLGREEILEAMQEALRHFNPPAPMTEAQEAREEMLATFRECLEEMKPSWDSSTRGPPLDGYGEQVLSSLHELVEKMRAEFKSYSSANGRDTEQVLDAMKDGLESLRSEIESYVDRAQDVTGKDEIIDTVRAGFNTLRADVEKAVGGATGTDGDIGKTEMLDYIKSEFEHLHATIGTLNGPATGDKDEILHTIKSGFESIASGGVARSINGEGESTSVPDAQLASLVKEEFAFLREALGSSLVRSGSSIDKDDVLDVIRESFDGLRGQLTSGQSDLSDESLAKLKDEIEHLRETLGKTLVRGDGGFDKDEIMFAIRSGLEELNLGNLHNSASDGNITALRADIESLGQSIATGLARNNTRADTEEVLDAVRLGLDDLRSHLEKKIDNQDRHMNTTSELIDAFNEGLDSLRTDISKVMDKPVDMTVSYEILETLKEGISGLRNDLDHMKGRKRSSTNASDPGNAIVLAEDLDAPLTQTVNQPIPAGDALQKNDLERMEVMLSQLKIKVEAMDANIQSPPEHVRSRGAEETTPRVAKEDLAGIEDLLKDLQAMVTILAGREREETESAAKKEDTDAIETLVRNTKAQIEELFPDSAVAATRDHLSTVEGGVKAVHDAVDALASRLDENGAVKADVAVVELLVNDVKVAIDELKELQKTSQSELITKTDFDILGVLCTEVKSKIEEMKLPNLDDMPSKAEVEQLTGLIHDFRESHDRLKDSYESDIAITAKAFDDRKKEAENVTERIGEVKAFVEELKDDLKAKVFDAGLDGLTETIRAFEGNFAAGADLKELMETVAREFERANGAVEGLKADQQDKAAINLEKQDEMKTIVVEEISQKIDESFDVIMSKYDDAQISADTHVKVMEEKVTQQEEILSGVKTMADDLKLTIDTLGMSIMGMNNTFTEATEKVAQDSQTVFGRIDEACVKIDEKHAESKSEYEQTRQQIANALAAIGSVQSDITEFNPKFMVTLQEVLALVNRQLQQTERMQETAQTQIREAADQARIQADEIKSSFTSLPALLPPPPSSPPVAERFDDTHIREKLDRLLDHSTAAEKSSAHLGRLDQIHQQVMASAAEISAFVAVQTKSIAEEHGNKEKEAEEVALLLERRLAQKEQLEADIGKMNAEKESVHELIEALRDERDGLAAQKSRLAADVSALETALSIRREELHIMDTKANALERRIMEGIMDHSRALLLSKGAPARSMAKTKQRNVSNSSQSTTTLAVPPSAAASGLSMALKRPNARRSHADPASRRILSLSTITNNVPTGSHASQFQIQSSNLAMNTGLKRSHSVKTPYQRKTSWNGAKQGISDLDKENQILQEETEPDTASAHDRSLALIESPGVERRISLGDTASEYTYGTGSYLTGTGSYITGTDLDRRTSYGSTARSALDAGSVIDEESEEDDAEDGTRAVNNDAASDAGESVIHRTSLGVESKPDGNGKDIVLFQPPSDSGLGTDLPTAGLGGGDADYFRRAAEEESTVG